MKILTFTFLIFLSSISFLLAQSNQYHEFADHQWISSTYNDVIPRGPESAYLIQNASLAKVEGRTINRIYTPNWACSEFSIFTIEEDTIIYMYEYFDYDIGIDIVTKIKIGKDSVQIINPVDDYFNNGCIYPMIRLGVNDIIVDSLGRELAFHREGVHQIIENVDSISMMPNLDTIFISNNSTPFRSKLIKNATHDIFVISLNKVYPILSDYSIGSAISLEEEFKKIKFVENKFYVLYRDHITIYENDWQNTNERIEIDTSLGEPKDFIISEKNEAIVLQDSDQVPAQTVRYDNQTSASEVLYQETLASMQYEKIRMRNDILYSIGKHREVPVLGIQANTLTENDKRLNISIEDISIIYSVEIEDNCNYHCEDYTYDISYTLKNDSPQAISNFSIAAYRFPLSTSFFSSPRLFVQYHKDTLIMPNEMITFEGVFESSYLWGIFPFEIMGNNFALDANFNDSVIEFTDVLLNTNKITKPTLPFQAYPNPAQGTIYLDSVEPVYKVDVYHINGRLIKSQQSQQAITQIDLPQLPDGLYTLRIWDRALKKFGIQKVMIQH